MAKPQAAVIGSGFGGISAAIRLQAAGFNVHVFEKRDLPGGRAYVFKDKGFTFDAGPTVITAPDCIKELFDLSGKKMEDYVQLIPVQPFYRLMWEDGYKFDYTNNDPFLYSQIEKRSPPDVQGYKNFLEYSREVFNEGYTNLVHVPFLSIWSMIKVAPQLIRLGAYRSVYHKVSKYIRDSRLREAFSFHSLLVGGNPFSASSIYTLIHYLEKNWGVFFAKGGTGALVQGLVRLFQDLGGTIHLNSEIGEILTEDQRVYGVRIKKTGEIIPCDLVVSNADVARTYRDLLKNETALNGTRRHVLRMKQSMSLFLIYFGTKKKFDTAHHSVIFGPRYKELLKDIFNNGKLSDDFSLYLHAPCRTDESLAPEGCDTFYVLSPVPNLQRSNIDWKTEGPKYADKILSYLDQHYMPGLKNEIVTQRIFTPLDFESELNSQFGAAFSFQPTLTQSAYFRTHNRDRKVRGLYFVGAGTHPGAGVPGVINSAKATAGLVIDDHAKALISMSREMISRGSKSFSLASQLFVNEKRDAAHCLYGWCRYCDDQIDIEDPKTAGRRLENLIQQTKNAYSKEPVDFNNPVFQAMSIIVKKYNIPMQYPLDLLQGMQMDVEKREYETIDDLLAYCYCVAGTVGLMMAHVMGVSDENALKNACDLGTAMQLTNIARDIMEDAAMGRVYLPQQWLREAGIDNAKVADPKYRKEVFAVVKRLLDYADHYYYSGESGLKYLSLRSAFTIASASGIYSEIGRLVLSRGEKAWDQRAIVSLPRKIWIVANSLFKIVEFIPERIFRPWTSTLIKQIWRPI
jgi:phytoene desaturase